MNILILVSLILSFGVLLITEGLYVTWGELMILVVASCFIAILIRSRYRKQEDVPHSFIALVAFGLFWTFSLFDLIGDHFLYYLPQEGVFYDGRPLTLREKINEFKDDLLVVSWFPPLVSLFVSYTLSKLMRTKIN